MPAPAVIAITPGEPGGIGPDLSVLLTRHPIDCQLVFVADPQLLGQRAQQLGLELDLPEWQPGTLRMYGAFVLPVSGLDSVAAGRLNKANAAYVIETLKAAVQGCLDGSFDALVTGPVHKGIINDAGIPFSGHTEFLAQISNTPQTVMMLVADTVRVALVTTHLPLSRVCQSLNRGLVKDVIEILHRELKRKFDIPSPRILVCGLNPHAGESGHLGREEIDIIEPVIKELSRTGIHLVGPLPADTIFTPPYLQQADVILAMYHDQGLPTLKHIGFGRAVNVTLGLPFIRTSVDHGTALDRAGTGDIEISSMKQAIKLALKLCQSHGSR